MLSFVMANATENRCRLCLVTPPVSAAEGFIPRLAEAVSAGDVATLVVTQQGSDRGLQDDIVVGAIPIAHAHGVAVIVADRLPAAAPPTADGVQYDARGPQAWPTPRKNLAAGIVGLDGLRNRHDAIVAGEFEPDYLFFGRLDGDTDRLIFDPALRLAQWWASVAVVPAVVMGGQSLESVDQAAAAGLEFVALRDAVWGDRRGPGAAVADANARLRALEAAA